MAVHSPYGAHYGAPVGRSRSEGDAYQRPPLESLAVTSTSPPCVPKLPPSPRTARPAPSILRNPLSPEEQRKATKSNSPPSILKALPGRRKSSVVVEIIHSPPPPDFDGGVDQNGDSSGVDDSHSLTRISTNDLFPSGYSAVSSSSSLSPPRGSEPALAGGGRSRSVSPMSIPGTRGRSETRTSTASSSSAGADSARGLAFSGGAASSVMTDSSLGSVRSDGSCVKFAPLPPGRRAHRSNSLSIGVASRAKMIQSQGGTPNVRTARYAGPQLWYEGGSLPEDVYTWKDAQKGLQKLFKRGGEKGKSEKGKEVAVEGDVTPRPERGRSASVSSVTSSSDPEDARRMEREAKGKVREIEHIEEVDDEDGDADVDATGAEADVEDNLYKIASPAGPAPAIYSDRGGETEEDEEEDDDAATSASEITSPRTPPENGLQLSGVSPSSSSRISDGDLDVERRRVLKGKGKAIDDAEHGEVRVAS
ncbi:hypothetical protein JCM10908_001198 [Rhodotorula pacifica]|uniref:uncharacterized protein n=1 Tax=Rhodotorula pacifica TaxID=1495444 RepID=UPI00317417EB